MTHVAAKGSIYNRVSVTGLSSRHFKKSRPTQNLIFLSLVFSNNAHRLDYKVPTYSNDSAIFIPFTTDNGEKFVYVNWRLQLNFVEFRERADALLVEKLLAKNKFA